MKIGRQVLRMVGFNYLKCFGLMLFFAANQTMASESQDNSAGKSAYQVCVACHGSNGEGNKALNAPALAGSSTWYVQTQLTKFKTGVRGTHADDQFGKQMTPFAASLNDEQIEQVSKYIANMSPLVPESSLSGDLAKGQQTYIVCGSCHGAQGQGNKALNSPRLVGLNDWYLMRQLQHFRSGVRGQHPNDKHGLQMAKMAQLLKDEQEMKDVASYIGSLSQGD